MSDQQLVNDFLKHRSERAFRKLYQAQTPRLYQFALRMTANHHDNTMDLIQETWMVAIAKLPTFRWQSELRTWLTGILINQYRSSTRLAPLLFTEELIESSEFPELEAEEPMIDKEKLELALQKLSPGYRTILMLHAIEGYQHDEIAAILGISIGTSKSQLHHARKSLKRLLNQAK